MILSACSFFGCGQAVEEVSTTTTTTTTATTSTVGTDTSSTTNTTTSSTTSTSATTTTLPAPGSASISGGSLQTVLTWEAVSGAVSYDLYWSNTSGVTKSNGTKVTGATSPYGHTGLINGKTYYYIVCGVDAAGNEGASSAQAAATPEAEGALDTSFNSVGYAVHNNAGGANADDYGSAVTSDSSERVVVAGRSMTVGTTCDVVVWRYNGNGTLDTSFNSIGYALHNNAAGGGKTDQGNAVALDSSGRIVVGGSSRGAANYEAVLWRWGDGGALDTTFNSVGYVVSKNAAGGNNDDSVSSVAVDSSGRIVAAGSSTNASGNYDIVVWRYNSDGTTDESFGTNGFVVTNNVAGGNGADVGNGLALDASGRIVVTGYSSNGSNNDMVLLRYTADGALDTGFGGGDGIVVHNNAAGGDNWDTGSWVTLDASGRIVVTGFSSNGSNYDMVVWRYTADGTLDTTFNSVGYVVSDAAAGSGTYDCGNSVGIDLAGKIVVTGTGFNSSGNADMVLWRYNADGTPDTSFGSNGVAVSSNVAGGTGTDAGNRLCFDASGRILISGWSYNASGNYDMVVWRYR